MTSMSDFSDRLDDIRKQRDKSYASLEYNEHLYKSLPKLHRDCYWLLDVVDMLMEDKLSELLEET